MLDRIGCRDSAGLFYFKSNKMKCKIITLNPETAKELLSKNIGNRKIKRTKGFYSSQMINGDWKENGEPIIIDTNGIVKDGQHRMYAVIEADYSYQVPLVYDVNPDVMDTIDTGSNRGLNDVLELNGFKNSNKLSSILKGIMSYDQGLIGTALSVKGIIKDRNYVSNKTGLEFAMKNSEDLASVVRQSCAYHARQTVKVFSIKDIGVMIYVIAKFNFKDEHDVFIKNLLGVTLEENKASTWLYKKLLDFNSKKISVTALWRMAAFIKVWNIYITGDVPVNYLRIDVSNIEKPISI